METNISNTDEYKIMLSKARKAVKTARENRDSFAQIVKDVEELIADPRVTLEDKIKATQKLPDTKEYLAKAEKVLEVAEETLLKVREYGKKKN